MSVKKKFLIVAAAVILILAAAAAFELPKFMVVEAPLEEDFPKEYWAKDIDCLKENLPKKHKNLFFKITREEFNKKLDDIKTDLPNLSNDEIEIRIMEVMASIGDAHTSLKDYSLAFPDKVYPVETYIFSDGIYAVKVDSKYKEALGKKLAKINGIPVDEVMKRLDAVIPHENNKLPEIYYPAYIMNPKLLKYYRVTDGNEAVFTFTDEKSKSLDIKIAPQDRKTIKRISLTDNIKEKPLYMKNSDYFWYEYLPEDNMIYFQYNACTGKNKAKKSFKDMTDEILKLIDEKDVEKFVMDMRNNSGGSSFQGTMFIKKLSNMDKINKKGKIFGIVGRKTFSSAILNSLDLRNDTEAVLIGEPTGGRPNHYGEVRNMQLPKSKLSISYSTKYFENSKQDTDSLIPDKIVELSFKDFINGIDPVMEEIKRYQAD